MNARMGVAAAVLWLGAAAAQTDIPADTLLLARIKVRAAANLQRQPNFTCIETIERSLRRATGRRFELQDTIRLEVAYVGGKEMFAWPGAQKFDDREISEMVGGGTIGTGSFAIHPRALFMGGAAQFTYVGEVVRENRSAVRYNYRVPRLLSGYKLRVPPQEGITGYHGSFWVDPASLDLIRIEVEADDIPSNVPILTSVDSVDYQKVRIGDADFLLPHAAETVISDLQSNEHRNRIQFTGCRQYSGESVIHFEDAPTGAKPAAAPPPHITLPGGLVLSLLLDTEIRGDGSAIGDPVRAIVESDVKKSGKVIVPKGAVALGRIARLHPGHGTVDYWALGLEFSRLELADRWWTDLRVRMVDAAAFGPSGILFTSRPRDNRYSIPMESEVTGPRRIGILYLRGAKLKLSRGVRMSWRTEAPADEERK